MFIWYYFRLFGTFEYIISEIKWHVVLSIDKEDSVKKRSINDFYSLNAL